MYKYLFLAVAIPLVACGEGATSDAGINITKSASDPCGALAAQVLVGKPVSDLDSIQLPKETRVIGPDTAVTMDFREDRLNLETKDSMVSRAYCG